jgi:phage recombination protein Bet
MSELTKIENSQLSIWEGQENLQQIKKIFAPKLNDLEFTIFAEMGKATGLNPFLKEIWAVKYSDKDPAQIFIGRDGHRKSAQRHPLYKGHNVMDVYSNDDFLVSKFKVVKHEWSAKDRGTLLGAYCEVNKQNIPEPFFIYVPLSEYDKGFSVWKEKKSTMIKKVSESQCLKAAFQELFGGTYSEYEITHEDIVVKNNKIDDLNKKLLLVTNQEAIVTPIIYETENIDSKTGEIIIEEDDNKKRGFSFDDLKSKLEQAKTPNELIEAVDAVRSSFINQEEKDKLLAIYKTKQKEINSVT